MASGQVLDRLFPPGEPPASTYATVDLRNNHVVLDYDAAADELIYWTCVLPLNYAGGGLTLRFYWSATSATSGDVVWATSIERIDDSSLDVDADSFASGENVTATAPGTSGQVKYTDKALTDGAQMDSLAAGELYRIRINRLGSSGSDTMTGDAELHGIMIKET